MNLRIMQVGLAMLGLLAINHINAEQGSQGVYQKIKKLLDQYKRPITVLEINANTGFYSLQIAHDYKAFCVMADEDLQDRLLESCKEKKYADSLMLLKKRLSPEELLKLAECEHFDVVLMMHGVEQYPENWEEVINTALNLGDHIFIQTPIPAKLKLVPHTQRKIYQYLKSIPQSTVETFPVPHSKDQTALFALSRPKKFLKRKYWTYKRKASDDEFVIESNFEQKIFHKKKGNKKLPWQPGINLLTFKTLNGVFPLKETVRDKLAAFKGIKHTDLHIWNVVIQGETLIPIDGDDKALHYNPKYTLQYIIAQFKRMLSRYTVLNDMDISD